MAQEYRDLKDIPAVNQEGSERNSLPLSRSLQDVASDQPNEQIQTTRKQIEALLAHKKQLLEEIRITAADLLRAKDMVRAANTNLQALRTELGLSGGALVEEQRKVEAAKREVLTAWGLMPRTEIDELERKRMEVSQKQTSLSAFENDLKDSKAQARRFKQFRFPNVRKQRQQEGHDSHRRRL